MHAIEQSAHFDCKNKLNNLEKFLKSLIYFLNKERISILKLKKEIKIFMQDFQQR